MPHQESSNSMAVRIRGSTMRLNIDLVQLSEIQESIRELDSALKSLLVIIDIGKCAKWERGLSNAATNGDTIEVELCLNDIQVEVKKDKVGITRLRLNEPRLNVIYIPPPPLLKKQTIVRKERIKIQLTLRDILFKDLCQNIPKIYLYLEN